ncbi:S8 family serine peptidase [uncultured Desulfosarcina sp.]|uniref:S8 family serine peptidase n=1 Tax=uncultured Desulfosarcina sp. TaxID=218289 RepID=UPI0029C6C1BE|nr:S8 family serine peptidase [uncultured Desulfosarcina sp.]
MQANRTITGFMVAILLLAGGRMATAGAPDPRPFVDGEVLVKYRESTAVQQALHYRSMWRMNHVRTFKNSGIRKVRLPEAMTVAQAVALYQSDPDVIFAEPNYRYRLQAVPDDTNFSRQWGLVNTGQTVNSTAGTADADMDAELAWDLETGSSDIVVAVVDSGIDPAHPDLAANIWTNPGEIADNGVDDDGNGYVDDVNGWDFADDDNHPNDPTDNHGHGTHVAGIIGAVGDNATGIAGVNWQVSIMPLRFITAADYGTTADAIAAIEYATDNGADVINLSWGGPGESEGLKNVIDAAGAAGVLVVCAAGNDANDLEDVPTYPASYNSANILSVAASNADDDPAWFTNYSDSQVDVAAPGTNVYSTVPDRQTLVSETFGDLGAWTFGGTGSDWGQQNLFGNMLLTESPDANYSDGMNAWAQMEPMDLTGRTGTRLDFYIAGITNDTGDRLYVEASTDGSTWDALWIGLDNGAVTAVTGNIGSLQLAVVDLKVYDGSGSFYLRFRFVSDDSGTADGYCIDNLAVTCADTSHGTSAYQYYNGTSMSAAYASGAAALIMARQPTLTPTEVRLVIESTVDQKAALNGYTATGGRINLYNALVSMAAVTLDSQASANRIDLDWTASEPVDTGFEIQRRPNSGSEYETIAIVGVDEAAYSDSGLADGTTYVYRLLTLSGGERTGYSNETAATTPRAVSSTVGSSSGGGGGGGGCFISADFGGWDVGCLVWLRPVAVVVAILMLILIVAVSLRQRIERPAIIGTAGDRRKKMSAQSSLDLING